MAFPPRFLDDLRTKVSLVNLIGRKVKLQRKGHDYVGLCPFHREKTPSFSVSEEKGFYHCFGCGAHGDAITFLINMEKMGFLEAVEYLAHSVGMEVPKASPEQMARAKKQTSLYGIMEKACQFYETQLLGPAGKEALQYLRSRGLDITDIKHFRLGYAPGGNALRSYLLREGCDEKDLIELGLVCKTQDHFGDNFDYFRDRVLFTIMDKRGHPIGFGGRVMGAGEPKYLNSPETQLFHKGENLYAYTQAIDGIRENNNVVLVEGYMDVIALHKVGINYAVAPLGTALTPEQIQILWRVAPEPIICFDGDNAGRRAAERACNRALPILSPGHSLRFVWLPDGLDPDDFAKAHGKEGVLNLFKSAKSLSWFIWNRLIEGKNFNTPEKLALLEKEVSDVTQEIQNPTVRGYYEKELKAELKNFTRNMYYSKKTGTKRPDPVLTRTEPMPILAPHLNEAKMLLAYMIAYPETCGCFLEQLSFLKTADRKIQRLLEILTNEMAQSAQLSAQELHDILEHKYSKNIFIYLATEMEVLERAQKTPEEVKLDVQKRMRALQLFAIEEDISALMKEFEENPTPELWTQILALKQEKEKLIEII